MALVEWRALLWLAVLPLRVVFLDFPDASPRTGSSSVGSAGSTGVCGAQGCVP